MTEQEREAAFLQTIREAERRFGCTVVAWVTTKKYGEALMVEPAVKIIPIMGWTPPTETAIPETQMKIERNENGQ